ncbi:MAG: hypothetical protein MJ238_04770, partial [Bacilli bacterium]|nr:hypothetical protein [Bacilli bacterium]
MKIDNKKLSNALHLCIDEGYEIIAIRDVVLILEKCEDLDKVKWIRECLIDYVFDDEVEWKDEVTETVLKYYADYQDKYEKDSVILDKCSASLVGYHYLLPRFKKQAKAMLRRAANWGYANAQFILGEKLLNKDETMYEGRFWLSQASEKGYEKAKTVLGLSLFAEETDNGKKVGLQYLNEAYCSGDREALFVKELKKLYDLMEDSKDEKEFFGQLNELEKICNEGFYQGYHIIAKALNDSEHYSKFELAMPFLLKASEYGYAREAYEVSKYFSIKYDESEDMGDLQKALHYSEIAIRAKNKDSKLNHAVILLKAERYDDARTILETYAMKGDGFALRELGLMHQLGKGFEEDYDVAVALYKKAIESGYQSAEYDIGYAKYFLKKDPSCIEIFIKGGEAGYSHCYYTL